MKHVGICTQDGPGKFHALPAFGEMFLARGILSSRYCATGIGRIHDPWALLAQYAVAAFESTERTRNIFAEGCCLKDHQLNL